MGGAPLPSVKFTTDLTVDQQADTLAGYMPDGAATAAKYRQGSTMRRLLRGLGHSLSDVTGLLNQVARELDPRYADQLISEWEAVVGIPGPVFDGGGSLEERRRNVEVMLLAHGAQTVDDFTRLAALLGVDITIRYAARHGTFPAEFPMRLYDTRREAVHTLFVDFPTADNATFPMQFPVEFGSARQTMVQRLLDLLKPAHARFEYTAVNPNRPPEPDFWMPLAADLRVIRGVGTPTFTRSTTKTYVDPSGVLRTAAVNAAAFESDGIRIGGSSTNRVTLSNQYQACAINSVPSPVPLNNSALAPDGTQTAWTLDPASVGNTDRCQRNLSGSVTTSVMAVSCFMKSTIPGVVINFGASTSLTPIASAGTFDFDSMQFTSQGVNCENSFEELADGWIRFSFVLSNPGGASVVETIGFTSSTSPTEQAGWKDRDLGLQIWGWQAEARTSASGYIPTLGTPVTKAADRLAIPEGALPDGDRPNITVAFEINEISRNYPDNDFGVVVTTGTPPGTRVQFSLSHGATTNPTHRFMYLNGEYYEAFVDNINGTNVLVYDKDSGSKYYYLNGVQQVVAPIRERDSVRSDLLIVGSDQQSFNMKNLRIWNRALTAAEVAVISRI